MSKYIPAEKLIAELERRIKENEVLPHRYIRLDEDKQLLSFITSLQQEQPDNMIQWTGNNLKEVIDFTGKSPRFGEWFKSWEEYENYVHTHNDILKLFCEDGSHYEVPVGAWIVKTPDGYNMPSVARYIQHEQPLTIEKVVEQCKKFGGHPEVIQQEQKCIFGNIPSEDICSVCSAYCSLRVPKTKVSTSTEIATSSGQVEKLTFEEYLRGVFEINNGIENDPDNLVRIRAPELLKLARKQEQPEVDLGKEIGRWMDKLDDKYCILVEDYSIQDIKDTARHFYELGQCTKYQQDRAEFAKLKAKEWQEGYDEGYAKGINAKIGRLSNK